VAAVINQRNRLLSLEKRLVFMEKRIAGMFSEENTAGPADSTAGRNRFGRRMPTP
jgi:hypothetical protein